MRHFLFDTTMNINGMWSGYTGPGAATIVPEKATAKIDFRLVPNQDVTTQQELVEEHLRKHGFGDFEYRSMGGGDEWSQTSVPRTARPVASNGLSCEPRGTCSVAALTRFDTGSAVHQKTWSPRRARRDGTWRQRTCE